MKEITLGEKKKKKEKFGFGDFFYFLKYEDSEAYFFLKSMKIWVPVLTLVCFLSFAVPVWINNSMYQKWLKIEPKYTLKEFDAECTNVIKTPVPTSKDEDFKETISYRYSWVDSGEKHYADTAALPAELGEITHIYYVTATKGEVAESLVTLSYDEVNEAKDNLEREFSRYKASDAVGYLFLKDIDYGAREWFVIGAINGYVAFLPWAIASFLTAFTFTNCYSEYKECCRRNND